MALLERNACGFKLVPTLSLQNSETHSFGIPNQGILSVVEDCGILPQRHDVLGKI
jgi:hypothetical protein